MVPNCVPLEKVEKMDNNIEKAVRPEISKETLLEVIKELQEVIIGMISTEDAETEEDMPEIEGMPEMESANPAPIGDPNKNEVNWPVDKVDGQLMINPTEKEILDQAKNVEPVNKTLWGNIFGIN